MLPRFFIPSSRSTSAEPTRDEPRVFEEIVAKVSLGPVDMFVGTDGAGRLRAVDASARRELPARAQGQLAFHEVASNRSLAIDATELYLFDLQMVELLRDAPGLNDPLYLYGVLRGPYPGALDTETAAIEGQLTVSRGDLLAGLIDGVERAFSYERSESGARCVHALLPGETADVVEGGRGLILAFPLAPTSLMGGFANDLIAAQIFYDVLGAMRAELGVTGPLPIPNRSALEDRLQADGWTIEGDTATRRAGKGVVASLLGRGQERRSLPRQGTLEDYVAEATAMLARLGAPPPTTVALRRRAMPRAETRATPPTRTTPPSPPAPVPPPPPVSTARPRVATPQSEWIQDFVDAHRAPDRPPPQLRRPARAVAPDPEQEPDWLDDFAEVPDAGEDPPQNNPAPDWSKDFD